MLATSSTFEDCPLAAGTNHALGNYQIAAHQFTPGPDRWGRFVVAGVVALRWLLQLRVLASLLLAGLPRAQAVVLMVPLLALSFYRLQVDG